MQTLATAVALPVSVGLVVLLVWNMLLLLRNQTTIEYHEGAATTPEAAALSSYHLCLLHALCPPTCHVRAMPRAAALCCAAAAPCIPEP
jgi:hypothetical protein